MARLPDCVQNRIANEMYEAALNTKDRERTYLGMSQIGHACSRKLWYDFRGFPPIPPEGRIIMLFRFGDRIEDEIVYHLNLAGYQIDGQQAAFTAHNGYFKGHCDGVIHGVSGLPHILECKSANTKKFAKFKQYGVRRVYPVYYSQCQCYMGYAGLERALVVVQCKDSSEIYTERITFVPSDFKALHQRAYAIITANESPDKINDNFVCGYCEQRFNCRHLEEAVMPKRVCGTCHYLYWKELTTMCGHPGHNFAIRQWGIGCPDWVCLIAKEPVKVKKVTRGVKQ